MILTFILKNNENFITIFPRHAADRFRIYHDPLKIELKAKLLRRYPVGEKTISYELIESRTSSLV